MFRPFGIGPRWAYPTLEDALAAWRQSTPSSMKAATVARYQRVLHLVLANEDLARLDRQEVAWLRDVVERTWPGRGSRNVAFSALRRFLLWAQEHGAGQRSFTRAMIHSTFTMERRQLLSNRLVAPLALDELRATLATFPLRTRALVGMQVAYGLAAIELVSLRLDAVTLPSHGVRLQVGQGERELVGIAMTDVRRYVKQRQREAGAQHDAPLFEGCAGVAISAAYARTLLRQVAVAAGLGSSLVAIVKQQAGGIGGW